MFEAKLKSHSQPKLGALAVTFPIPEELGKYMIQQSGHYEYDENLEDFYNYGDYGVKRILQDDGVFVDRGYVS